MTDHDCWCGTPHNYDVPLLGEALRNLGHALIALVRIPQLVARLARYLDPPS